jgi:hypothetical protein
MVHDQIPIDTRGKARYPSAQGRAAVMQELCLLVLSKGKHLLRVTKMGRNQGLCVHPGGHRDGQMQCHE